MEQHGLVYITFAAAYSQLRTRCALWLAPRREEHTLRDLVGTQASSLYPCFAVYNTEVLGG